MITDTERVCRMHQASIRELCGSHYTSDQIEAWAGPKRPDQYEPLIRDLIVFIVEEGDDVVAFGALDVTAADIRALYVAPEFVGRGIGSRVLEAMESEARRLALPTLSVSATLNSVGFYGALNRRREVAPVGGGCGGSVYVVVRGKSRLALRQEQIQ